MIGPNSSSVRCARSEEPASTGISLPSSMKCFRQHSHTPVLRFGDLRPFSTLPSTRRDVRVPQTGPEDAAEADERSSYVLKS